MGALTRPSATLSQRERGFDTPCFAGNDDFEGLYLAGMVF